MQNMKEIWKPVVGYEERYEVSNLGRVKSLIGKTERILKPIKHKAGYNMCSLHKNGKQRMEVVHRVVAKAFILNPKKRRTVNHIDGNKENNNISNLEWASDSENLTHSYRDLGREPSRGRRLHSDEEIHAICKLLERKRPSDVAKELSEPYSLVSHIHIGIAWEHISKDYKFIKIKDSGENRYNSKLTMEQAREIREEYKKGNISSRGLGLKYGISKSVILNIVNNRSYKEE